MPRPLLEHMERVRSALSKLPKRNVIAFAAACAERQLPVYRRATQGTTLDRSDSLRRLLDDVWVWLTKENTILHDTYDIEGYIPDEIKNGASSAVADIVIAFMSLAEVTELFEETKAAFVCETSLNLIDALLYAMTGLTVSSDTGALLDDKEVMMVEMSHQCADLKDLCESLSPTVVKKIRDRSVGRSVFGESWYTDSESIA